MPPTLQELLSGETPSVLRLHLAEPPLVEPYSLAELREPSWTGYTPAVMQLDQQSLQTNGWAWIQGSGSFTYQGQTPAPLIAAVFVTATYQGSELLLCVIDLAETGYQQLHQGTNVVSVRIDNYVMPAS